MNFESFINIIILFLTIIGFVIGFINPTYRLVAWVISFIIFVFVIFFLVVKDYVSKIDNNCTQLKIIRKDLNISNRLSNLEGKFEIFEKMIGNKKTQFNYNFLLNLLKVIAVIILLYIILKGLNLI